MLFDLNGNTYRMAFSRAGNTTRAILSIKDGDIFQDLHHADSICSEKDRFEKSKGRKVALARLLNDLDMNYGILIKPLSKEDRTKIWEIYFKEHKK